MRPLALITGASSGIGAVFAAELAARGFDLLLVARRKARLEELSAKLALSRGIIAEVLAADLATDAGLAVVEQRIAASPALELLVNNAGFGTRGAFFQVDVEGEDRMHRLHVLATMRLSHGALQGMVARGKGAIINVSSVAAFWYSPGVSYCATKCWMNNFTEGLALQLKITGSPVKVQALCPGYTLSEFHDAAGMDRGAVPKGLWMNAEDVVRASLVGLDHGDLFVIPGWQYKVAVFFLKHAPRWLVNPIAASQQRRLKRD
jgi:short-subunit dehydrogenase